MSRLAISGLLLVLLAASAHAEGLKLCALENDAPRAVRETKRGIDLDVVRELAGATGTTLEVVWVPNPIQILEIEDSDLPLGRLVRGDCDVVASVPGEESLAHFANRTALTKAYYGLAFELVGAGDLPDRAERLGETRTAVQLQTFAHQALEQLGVPWHAATSTEAALRVLDRGEVAAALVWGPDLGPLDRTPRASFVPSPALRWNAHLAMRRDDPRLPTLDAALSALANSGKVEALIGAHGIPYRAPFPSVSNPVVRRNLSVAP